MVYASYHLSANEIHQLWRRCTGYTKNWEQIDPGGLAPPGFFKIFSSTSIILRRFLIQCGYGWEARRRRFIRRFSASHADLKGNRAFGRGAGGIDEMADRKLTVEERMRLLCEKSMEIISTHLDEAEESPISRLWASRGTTRSKGYWSSAKGTAAGTLWPGLFPRTRTGFAPIT